jgi:hypothetical protein
MTLEELFYFMLGLIAIYVIHNNIFGDDEI